MQNTPVGFSVGAANPGVRHEVVTRWLDSGQSPTVSLTDECLRELPQSRDDPPVLARFSRPRAVEATRLAVVSDIHLSTRERGTWKMYHRTVPRLRETVRDIETRGVDGVIVPGDLTADGHPEDVKRVDEILSTLSVPVSAVPGNHDTTEDATGGHSFPSADVATDVLPERLPYHTRVGGVDLLCVDSTRGASGAKATLSAEQHDWLEGAIGRVETPVVVSHHNLPGLQGATGGRSWRSSFPMQNATSVSEVLNEGVPLHISGHLHLPAVAASRRVRELISPALCSFPGGYLLLDIRADGTTVRFVPVTDTPALESGWRAAREYKDRSRMVAWMAHRQLTELPLIEESPPADLAQYPSTEGA